MLAGLITRAAVKDALKAFGKAAAAKAGGFTAGQVLAFLTGGGDQAEVLRRLQELLENQEKILQRLDDLQREVVLRGLQGLAFSSTTVFEHLYADKLVKLVDFSDEARKREAGELLASIKQRDFEQLLFDLDRVLVGDPQLVTDGLFWAYAQKTLEHEAAKPPNERSLLAVWKENHSFFLRLLMLQHQGLVLQTNLLMSEGREEAATGLLRVSAERARLQARRWYECLPPPVRSMGSFSETGCVLRGRILAHHVEIQQMSTFGDGRLRDVGEEPKRILQVHRTDTAHEFELQFEASSAMCTIRSRETSRYAKQELVRGHSLDISTDWFLCSRAESQPWRLALTKTPDRYHVLNGAGGAWQARGWNGHSPQGLVHVNPFKLEQDHPQTYLWKLELAETPAGSELSFCTVEIDTDAGYTLRLAADAEKLLDAKGGLEKPSYGKNTPLYEWRFEEVREGTFRIFSNDHGVKRFWRVGQHPISREFVRAMERSGDGPEAEWELDLLANGCFRILRPGTGLAVTSSGTFAEVPSFDAAWILERREPLSS